MFTMHAEQQVRYCKQIMVNLYLNIVVHPDTFKRSRCYNIGSVSVVFIVKHGLTIRTTRLCTFNV